MEREKQVKSEEIKTLYEQLSNLRSEVREHRDSQHQMRNQNQQLSDEV